MDYLKGVLSTTSKALQDTILGTPEAEIWVREATSAEKSVPPTTLMHKISDETYNFQNFPIIMNTIWRRMHDTGSVKHVY
jgi:hypothetical protein